MFTLKDSKVIANNVVVINGFEVGSLTDEDAYKLADIVCGFMAKYNATVAEKPVAKKSAKTATKKLSVADDDKGSRPEEGKLLYADDAVAVRNRKGHYVLYINAWNKKQRSAIKHSAKEEFGAKFVGDVNANLYIWEFPTKEHARDFIGSQKAYNKKAQK